MSSGVEQEWTKVDSDDLTATQQGVAGSKRVWHRHAATGLQRIRCGSVRITSFGDGDVTVTLDSGDHIHYGHLLDCRRIWEQA